MLNTCGLPPRSSPRRVGRGEALMVVDGFSFFSCRGLCCRLGVLLCGCVAACSVPSSRRDNALSPSGGGWAAVGSPSLWGVPRPHWRRDSMRLAIARPLLARAAGGRAPLASHGIAIGRPPRGIRPWRGIIRPSIRRTSEGLVCIASRG